MTPLCEHPDGEAACPNHGPRPRRVPQLNDDVTVSVLFPPETEEWAEDVLDDMDVEIERTPEGLHVTQVFGGNCNAVDNAGSFLRDLAEALEEGQVDPMEFTLRAWATPRVERRP